MTCRKCHREVAGEPKQCPHCGTSTAGPGVFQTSTVLISEGGSEHVFRSVDEVPQPLRKRLLKSTNSPNSRTILIADSNGRRELHKAVKSLPGPAQKRLLQTLAGSLPPGPLDWFTPARRKWLSVLVAVLALALIAAVFLYRWK